MRKNILKCNVTGAEFEPNEAKQQLVGFIKHNDGSLQATRDINDVDVHICVDAIQSIHDYQVAIDVELAVK